MKDQLIENMKFRQEESRISVRKKEMNVGLSEKLITDKRNIGKI